MVLEEFWLPEVPCGDETIPVWLEMLFDLIKYKKLFFTCGQMMNNGNAENIVEKGKVFPGIRLGNVAFEKMGFGMIFDCFFQKCGGEVDAGIFDILGEA